MATKHLKGFSVERYDVGNAQDNTYILDKNAEYVGSNVQGIVEGDQAANNSYVLKGVLRGGWAIDTLGDSTSVSVSRTGDVYGANSAIRMNGEESSVVNRGHLTSGAWAIEIGGATYEIRNYGLIAGEIGTRTYHGGIVINEAGGRIIASDAGIHMMSKPGESSEIINRGMISGELAISTSDGDDHVVNSGKLRGDVELGAGDDKFDNRGGSLKGSVDGGIGDDLYLASSSKLEIIEEAAGGVDIVRSSADFALADYVEQLFLTGKKHTHGTGNDAANVINGNAGDNLLSGLGGVDQLYGGKGNDVLVGGDHNDYFYFATGDGHDTVADFASGTDQIVLIDLKGIDDFQDLITNHAKQTGDDVVIRVGNDTLTIEDIEVGALADADFQF